MINLILYGALAFVGYKVVQKKAVEVKPKSGTVQAQPGLSGTVQTVEKQAVTYVSGLLGITGPQSGKGTPQGNANQPWYTGAVSAAGPQALSAGAKALAGAFTTSSNNTPSGAPDDGTDQSADMPEVNSATIAEAYDEAATDSASSSDNTNDPSTSDDSSDGSGD